MNDEFIDTTFFANYCDEVHDVLPLVDVVDTESALDCDRNVHRLDRLLANLGDELGRVHELRAKAAVDCFLAGAPAVQVDLVVAPLLDDFGGLGHFLWVLSANLRDDWVLIVREVEQFLVSGLLDVDDGVLVDHLCVQKSVLRKHAHEKPIVVVGDIDHRRDGDPFLNRIHQRSLKHPANLFRNHYLLFLLDLAFLTAVVIVRFFHLLYLVGAVCAVPILFVIIRIFLFFVCCSLLGI